MRFDLLPPADQLIWMMDRIYQYGMTTMSGGNLSLIDDAGDLWITPAGVDKGTLTRKDMVCVHRDGTVTGLHRPSSELPFHQMIYRARPDLRAVVHAHPPALVSFSMARRIPDTRLLPYEGQICGTIGMADYALPGSEELGANIAARFAAGSQAVMLENHGVVVGGSDLFEAFRRFETLDFCARLEINARRLGEPRLLGPGSFDLAHAADVPPMPKFAPKGCTTTEREARREICTLVKRSYAQRLFTSTQGTFSQRVDGERFVITPYDMDRHYLEPEDLVAIHDGAREQGKRPSRSVHLHRLIYEQHPHVQSIIIAHPPGIMAYAVTDTPFDSRTIPESYILLRRCPKLPFDAVYAQPETTAAVFAPDTPIALVENNCVIVTGQSLLQAFDRLEVAEYSAKAMIAARELGEIVPIDDAEIEELKTAFKLP
ncbi:class II aldolase/adducin family protein [Paenibacillus sp. 1P07SE]|uniref:class II aldolase/adducin family protein n=1 Tax=Paenibacillus sp. 1P07SE TaxID=3132209 RepID=UPI0039A422EC